MSLVGKLGSVAWLKHSLYLYLMLGITDTLHHLHAAEALGHESAMHAVWTGVVLIPIAVLSVLGFLLLQRKVLLWVFVAIALLAVLLPGIYHGGWDHLLKILAHLRIAGESTDIRSLFPSDDLDLWFYEITGTLEFLLSLLTLFFVGKLVISLKRGKSKS